MKKCVVYGCEDNVHAKKLCGKHYKRYRKHEDVGVNYKARVNRLLINDTSSYLPKIRTCYENQALREIFYAGKYQGGLTVNYHEAIGID